MSAVKAIIEFDTNEMLIKAFRSSGDQELLARLYLPHMDMVYGTSLKYLKDHDLAKDAAMNIYHELIDKLRRQEVKDFKSWLYVVTKNHCLMQLRKSKKMTTVEFEPAVMQFDDTMHPDYDPEKEHDLLKLEVCLEKLQKDQQQAVRLFYMENKCYNEISEIVKHDWNKVRSLIQNGRRNLKNCMEKDG